VKDRAAVVTTNIMLVIRGAVSAAFYRQKVGPVRLEIEAMLRDEFAEAEREAVQAFRNNNPGA
jgi:hypothetical protein